MSSLQLSLKNSAHPSAHTIINSIHDILLYIFRSWLTVVGHQEGLWKKGWNITTRPNSKLHFLWDDDEKNDQKLFFQHCLETQRILEDYKARMWTQMTKKNLPLKSRLIFKTGNEIKVFGTKIQSWKINFGCFSLGIFLYYNCTYKKKSLSARIFF